jgi:hypothetical protein
MKQVLAHPWVTDSGRLEESKILMEAWFEDPAVASPGEVKELFEERKLSLLETP